MFEQIVNKISKTVIGNNEKIKLTLAAIISEGSILIEDTRVRKTTFAKSITNHLALVQKIQFTSDLLPRYFRIQHFSNEKLSFQKGPIFTNIAADELNRGSPKSQIF